MSCDVEGGESRLGHNREGQLVTSHALPFPPQNKDRASGNVGRARAPEVERFASWQVIFKAGCHLGGPPVLCFTVPVDKPRTSITLNSAGPTHVNGYL